MDEKIMKLQELIDGHDNIVFFGGAGVSTESGIPDFRSQDGLYHQKYDFPPETILSHSFFLSHPDEFYKFYRDKMLCDTAKPNAAHLKLAELEKVGKLKAVITQNIDNLHQMAGSQKVLELHGSVYRNHCMRCGKSFDFAHMKHSTGVPRWASLLMAASSPHWRSHSRSSTVFFVPGRITQSGAPSSRVVCT